ncbi:hypothetical protein E1B28_005414 [Marasmius oreades]|uniref:FAD-binding domain-containing protein n=1 Tax=Marasmius oreades TaxID=181124 RepID=A0A9P7S367_9AGAR|nr:uncharacterized protein E1B28_005414 [Marasmius oreades]KAG7094589.1 hypothetical protein E1B28_005414 [Marasmius oreades]
MYDEYARAYASQRGILQLRKLASSSQNGTESSLSIVEGSARPLHIHNIADSTASRYINTISSSEYSPTQKNPDEKQTPINQMQPPVLIVGAGPTGLSLALALLTNGVPVRIIRREVTFAVGTRGAGIQPRTQELLKLFNIWDDMEKGTFPLGPLIFHSSPERPQPLRIEDMSAEMDPKPEYYRINPRLLRQEIQEEIYRAHLKDRFNVEVELGTEFLSLTQHSDHVLARLVKHTADGGEVFEEARFAWLVGADGGRSQVRKELGLQFKGQTDDRGQVVLGDIHIKNFSFGSENEQKSFIMWGSPQDRMAFLIPTSSSGDRSAIMIGGKSIDMARVSSNKEELIKAFQDITGRKDIEFGDLTWISTWRLNIRMTDTFKEGRVFIAGDAAHTHSPTGGQGMNSSVQDSINLGWKLALVQRGLAPVGLLDTYTQERLPVIASMLDKTTELFRKTFETSHVGDQSGWYRGFDMRMFGVNYRGSPIVVDERYTESKELADPYRAGHDATVQGGDRAPEAPGLVEDGNMNMATSLYEVFKPTAHTVLIFDGHKHDPSLVVVLEHLLKYPQGLIQSVVIHPRSSSPLPTMKGASRVLEDREGFAYKNYKIGIDDAKWLVVVRPDAYVGALVEGVEGLEKYFSRIIINA